MNRSPKQFLALLARSDAVSIDGGPLLSSRETAELTGEDDNEVAAFSCTDGDYEYWYKIREIAIRDGYFSKDDTYVTSETIENDTEITFYSLTNLTPQL